MIRTTTVLAAAFALAVLVAAANAEPGLQSKLSAVSGQGSGHVELSPTAHDEGDVQLIAQGTAEIHGGLPNTTYLVQRATDPTANDGVCTIAPSPPAGWLTLTALTTSAGGAGAAHFVRRGAGPDGARFDVTFRVISENGTQILRSDCMTVTVK